MARKVKIPNPAVSPTNGISEYTEDQIAVVTNLEHIRLRPTGYIASKDNSGQVHMYYELLSNSLDELTIRPEGGVVHIVLMRDFAKKKYQLLIQDNGRGIPSGKLLESCTVLGASGKLGIGGAYNTSGGMYGFGSKVAPALATRYRILSSNNTESIVGSVYLKDGKTIDHHNEGIFAPYGVTIVVEPDLSFFDNGTEFMSSGYLDLVRLCKQMNIFNETIDFEFSVIDHLIPEAFWTADAATAFNIIDLVKSDPYASIEYSAAAVPDKSSYLFEMWKLNGALAFQKILKKDPYTPQDRLGFDIKLFFSHKSATGSPQYFVTVNNINLPDVTGNSASIVFLNVLRNLLLPYMETDQYRSFLLNEYRFPTLLLAIGIRYQGAELSGITKTSFKDANFAKQFSMELTGLFNFEDKEVLNQLYEAVKHDIELRYAQFYDTPQKKSEGKKVFADLKFPKNYAECKSSNPEECELYIVEGTSAAGIMDTRDNVFQAIYQTRGKPYNAATSIDSLAANRKKLQSDPIYYDLMHILNINPNTTDMNSARFKRIIIATDADPDGYHIGAIHLNNFYILNPRIIESGMVYLANPPLYSMNISKNRKLFLRDKIALTDARVEYLYRPTLDIRIESNAGVQEVTGSLYREMCYLIDHVGDICATIASQLSIPLLILERLIFALDALFPRVDYLKLGKYFESADGPGYVRVQVNETGRFIVVSVGTEDFPIGLDVIGDTIVSHLLPTLKKFKFYELGFSMRSKHRGSTMTQWTPASMLMIYVAMQQLNHMFKVYRYKGLGELLTDDCYETLMNPVTRQLTQVTSPGDPRYNYSLLGTDTTERKKLLTGSVVLSNAFAREQSM